MPIEIERKFVVVGDDWRKAVTGQQQLCDGLLAQFGGGKVRIRICADRASITVKGPRNGASRSEYEYEIPCHDAQEMIDTHCGQQVIQKTRFFVTNEGLAWTVDMYEAELEGLVIAEIELDHEEQLIELPAWVGLEVTHDPNYKKTNLLRRVSSGWRPRGP